MFLRKETLSGNKLEVYVLLKLLKTLTKAPVTSYKIKWAVDDMLGNMFNLSDDGIGPAIQEAMNHRSIRDKFLGIHPRLQELGYIRIEVTDTGFTFFTRNGKLWLFLRGVWKTNSGILHTYLQTNDINRN